MVKADELLKQAQQLRPAKRIRLDAPEDSEELREVRKRRRDEHELNIARHPSDRSAWFRYIRWEYEWGSLETTRAIYERCISGDLATDSNVWLRWAEDEVRNQKIGQARSVLDRATNLLPKSSKLWFLWLRVEKVSENPVEMVRRVFEKWLLHPTKEAWRAFTAFEIEQGNAREAFKRYVQAEPCLESWKGWAQYSENPRDAWTEAVDSGYTELAEDWAWWEAENDEVERGRLILQHTGRLSELVGYERAWGRTQNVNAARFKYLEHSLSSDYFQYDKWWEILDQDLSWSRNLVHARPTQHSKSMSDSWRAYVYLWLKVANKTELNGKDPEEVYAAATKSVNPLVFSKLSIAYAKAEVRWGRIEKARKVLGKALGMSKGQKKSLFRRYIEFEYKLREPDRVRKLYEAWIIKFPTDIEPWVSYARFESSREEVERARAIFAAAEAPVWREWADWEADLGHYDQARSVYSNAPDPVAAAAEWSMLEVGLGLGPDDETPDGDSIQKARKVLVDFDLKLKHDPERRYELFEVRQQFEERYGDPSTLQKPRVETRVIAGNHVQTFVFPDVDPRISRLLTNARQWQTGRSSQDSSK